MRGEHVLTLCSDFLSDLIVVPECSCGWTGSDHPSDAKATDEWEMHCDAVFYEAATSGRPTNA